ncbi:helix-turn-helix transcriptional regulator [Kitasatospora sp. NPDC001527]|uniref:helix-turn-helix domain-containing protein n=1 Tax=Kitasatospora sp. NPDC001527 TaxID=3154519 RepID=UPI0033195832
MAEDKKNPLGPTGEQVRRNVTRIREARGLTKKELSDRTSELGRPIPPLGVSRVEAGTRRVDADDLVVLAVALDVSPSSLLLPLDDAEDVLVEVTGAGQVPASAAWDWLDGRGLLNRKPGVDLRPVLDYEQFGRPPGRRPVSAEVAQLLPQALLIYGRADGEGLD